MNTKLDEIIKTCLNTSYFKDTEDGEKVFDATFAPGEHKILILTGDNASGKTLFAKLLQQKARDLHKMTSFFVGMNTRTVGGIRRAFMYGDDTEDSTGSISVNAINGCLRTCRGTEDEHYAVLDEPGIGLSDSFLAPLGTVIGRFAKEEIPEQTKGLILITHSRSLVKSICGYCKPYHIRFGDKLSLEEWIKNGSPVKTEEELLNLYRTSGTTSSQVEKRIRMNVEKRRKKGKK